MNEPRWGEQTRKAITNFPVSGRPFDPEVIHCLGAIKAESARVNAEIGVLDADLAGVIAEVSDEVAAGRWDEQFPVDVYQTGSGTSTNMNANEVIASLGSERGGTPVHPNDHVNASQSSNDVMPTAVRLAATRLASGELAPALAGLATALEAGRVRFADTVKAGRTHLMDAVPVTLGQEFGGYAYQVVSAAESVARTLRERVMEMPLGGTATGTGINAPAGFAAGTIALLAERYGLPLFEARNHFALQGGHDGLVELSAQLRGVAVALHKIANDLRAMASGPVSGLGEIHLPALQAGSSIMPGKVNPVIPEVVTQIVASVMGNDAAVAFAGAQGAFELNAYLPVIAHHVLDSVRLLTAAATLLAPCVRDLTADDARCRTMAERSAAVVTWITPVIGYRRAAEAVAESEASGRSVREVLVESGAIDDATADTLLDVSGMTRGGMAPVAPTSPP